MKRVMRCFLWIMLCLGLSACGEKLGDLHFYYPRLDFAFGDAQPVIVSEYREATGHEDDLDYLLKLYLEGPLDDTLRSPFPGNIALEGFTYSDFTLYVTLNDALADLSGVHHTLATACLAKTCFELTPAEKVIIKCNSAKNGNQSITVYRDSVLLQDLSTEPPEATPAP